MSYPPTINQGSSGDKNNPGEFLISDVVMIKDANPTLIRCIAYIMSLARLDPKRPSFVRPQPRLDQTSHGDGNRSDEENWSSYKRRDLQGEGPTDNVVGFVGLRLQQQEGCALKFFRLGKLPNSWDSPERNRFQGCLK